MSPPGLHCLSLHIPPRCDLWSSSRDTGVTPARVIPPGSVTFSLQDTPSCCAGQGGGGGGGRVGCLRGFLATQEMLLDEIGNNNNVSSLILDEIWNNDVSSLITQQALEGAEPCWGGTGTSSGTFFQGIALGLCTGTAPDSLVVVRAFTQLSQPHFGVCWCSPMEPWCC